MDVGSDAWIDGIGFEKKTGFIDTHFDRGFLNGGHHRGEKLCINYCRIHQRLDMLFGEGDSVVFRRGRREVKDQYTVVFPDLLYFYLS